MAAPGEYDGSNCVEVATRAVATITVATRLLYVTDVDDDNNTELFDHIF